jgi:hypothetical protein
MVKVISGLLKRFNLFFVEFVPNYCTKIQMTSRYMALNLLKTLIILALLPFLSLKNAFAQQSIQDRQLLDNKKKQNAFNAAGFNFQGSYTYTRKIIERSEAENSDYSIFSYSLLYRGFNPWMVRGGVSFFNDKDIASDENRQLYLSSGSVRLIRAPINISDFKIQPAFGFRLPIGQYDRKSESLILGSNASATVFLPSSWMPKNTLGIVGGSLTKNFHNYDTRLGAGPNTEWSADLYASLNYTLNQLVTLVLSGSYGTAFTYTPEAFEYYSFSQSVFMAYEKFNLSIGHSIESSVYAVDGINYDVRFFDQNKSRFYVNLGVNL